jgi:hypothetical protein
MTAVAIAVAFYILGQTVGLAVGYATGRRVGFADAIEVTKAREGQWQKAVEADYAELQAAYVDDIERLRAAHIKAVTPLFAQAAPYLCPPAKVESN